MKKLYGWMQQSPLSLPTSVVCLTIGLVAAISGPPWTWSGAILLSLGLVLTWSQEQRVAELLAPLFAVDSRPLVETIPYHDLSDLELGLVVEINSLLGDGDPSRAAELARQELLSRGL